MRRAFFLGPAKKGETPSIVAYTPDEVEMTRKAWKEKGIELLLDEYEYSIYYTFLGKNGGCILIK